MVELGFVKIASWKLHIGLHLGLQNTCVNYETLSRIDQKWKQKIFSNIILLYYVNLIITILRYMCRVARLNKFWFKFSLSFIFNFKTLSLVCSSVFFMYFSPYSDRSILLWKHSCESGELKLFFFFQLRTIIQLIFPEKLLTAIRPLNFFRFFSQNNFHVGSHFNFA